MKLTVKHRVTILNITANVFAWAGFGLGIAALSNTFWQVSATTRTGLFWTCSLQGVGCSNTTGTPWLLAVRAFLIMMVILDVIAFMVSAVGWCFKKNVVSLITAASAIYFVSCVFGVTALSVFTASTTSSADNYYGRTFIEGWIGAWCPLFSSVFVYIVVIISKNGYDPEKCGTK